jgi:hypothetical protein
MATANAWHVRGSWTDLTIPKPFSTAVMIAGTPVLVPKDLERDQMPAWSAALTAEMQRLDRLAERILSGDESAVAEIDRTMDPSYFACRTIAAAAPEIRAA